MPFAWRRSATGATQLALALLADALCDDAEERRLHQHFHYRVITNFAGSWTITRSRILARVRIMNYKSGGQPATGHIASTASRSEPKETESCASGLLQYSRLRV